MQSKVNTPGELTQSLIEKNLRLPEHRGDLLRGEPFPGPGGDPFPGRRRPADPLGLGRKGGIFPKIMNRILRHYPWNSAAFIGVLCGFQCRI